MSRRIRLARRRLLLPTIVALLCAVGAAGAATGHAPDPPLGSAWAQDQRLEFRWRSGAEPPAAIRTAIRDAAAGSNATRGSQAAVFVYDSGGPNLIGYGPSATCGVNGIGCFTRTAPDGGFTMWLREHGRVFDWGVLRWCEMYSSPPNGCYQAETIALDEFGHIQGLDHHDNRSDDSDYTDAVVQTFSRTKPRTGWDMGTYGRCDVARLQLRYDVPNTSAPYSTCLDIATTLTLEANPTSIAYGGSTTLTATLKVAGDDAYGRLRGNPVTNRTVRLQRRPPGTTTWTTIATMTAGSSGTYTSSIRLQSRTEFRAVFPTPAGEGLIGDTSGVVTVAVGACTGTQCPLRAPAE
jgi:hypothetical protein